MTACPRHHRTSVVIPTLNAMTYLPDLIRVLRAQEPEPPGEILVVDSDSRDGTADYALAAGDDVRLIPVERFTHGGARNLGARQASGAFMVFLSQDAMPRDTQWLAHLLTPFEDNHVAAAFSRQVPNPGASPMECFFLHTHFPPEPALYQQPLETTDLHFQRDVFFSNVSSAIRADVLRQCPFDETLIMSEDQQFARDVILAGHTIAYAPDSIVRHSHHYSWMQTLRRYVDSAYSLTQIFERHGLGRSARLGTAYLRHECMEIIRHHPLMLPRYATHVLAMTLGTVIGHYADHLPKRWMQRISLHSAYWRTAICLLPGALALIG